MTTVAGVPDDVTLASVTPEHRALLDDALSDALARLSDVEDIRWRVHPMNYELNNTRPEVTR